MENYVKGEVKELEDNSVFQDILIDGAIQMKVKAGSKIRNLMAFALNKMQEPTVKQIVWAGSGSQAVSKAITCAEIVKRKFKNLHQVNDIRFKRIEEYWEPKTNDLERLKVNRDIPLMSILLSKEPLDPSLLGYQGPGGIQMQASNVSTPGTSTVTGSTMPSASKNGSESNLKRKKKPKFKNGKKSNLENNV